MRHQTVLDAYVQIVNNSIPTLSELRQAGFNAVTRDYIIDHNLGDAEFLCGTVPSNRPEDVVRLFSDGVAVMIAHTSGLDSINMIMSFYIYTKYTPDCAAYERAMSIIGK